MIPREPKEEEEQVTEEKEAEPENLEPVSYTHLTLPTKA
mgnify:CR=1 FL=1